MLIKLCLLLFIGFAGGSIVAAGLYAFISLLKIMPRLATCTRTVKYDILYEDSVMLGAILGNLLYLFEWKLPLTVVFLAVYAVFSGMFVGCLAIALAEVLDVIPTFARRIKLKTGLSFIIVCTALGKGIGSLMQLIFMDK